MAHTTTSTSSCEDMYLSDIITGAHGDKYQTDLALIIFERATRKRYDFQLGYEMAIADKFDDVAFLNRNKNEWILIQTKHADTSKGTPPALKFDMLFPKDDATRDKGDFSLFKYLKSYVTVQSSIKERKNIIIFTNRDFLEESLEQSVEAEDREVDEILAFEKAKYVGLKVSESTVKEMVDYVNRDFNAVRDSIVKLFKDGTVDQVIKNFKTPIASILTKTNTGVKFSDNPPSDANQMLTSLSGLINFQTAQAPLNKCNDIFTGKSRNKIMPLAVDGNTVHNFFRDLVVLSVQQPDDLREIINQDVYQWIRTWVRPDYLLRLEQPQLQMCSVSLETYFNNKQSPIVIDKCSFKKFLNLSDGDEFFGGLKTDLGNQLRYPPNNYNICDASEFYISRQINIQEMPHCDGTSVQKKIRDGEFVDELFGKLVHLRFFLLTAEPGMGKSTTVKFIALAAQRKSNAFVYLFDLSNFNQRLAQVKDADSTDDLFSVFRTVLSEENFNNFRAVMQNKDNESKHLVIFDAFDEVSPKNRSKVLEIFSHMLKVSNVQLLVSARKSVKSLMENEFNVISMSLEPFDEQDQFSFLREFWKVPEKNDASFCKYVAHLFKSFHLSINRALCKFTGLPLMLKILAEVCFDNFKEFSNSAQNMEQIIPQERFRTINLYELSIKKCFANKMMKKFDYLFQDCDEDNALLFEKFILEHQLFAMKRLQITVLQTVLNSEKNLHTLQNFEERILKGTEKSPLVEVADGDGKFIHLSYAEFLVAKFLYCNFETYEAQIFGTRSDAYFFDEYPVVKIFLFNMVEVQYESKYLAILEKHYKKNNRIVLWACEVQGQKTVEFLLRVFCDSMVINQLLGVAAQHNCYNIYTYLIQNYQSTQESNAKVRTSLHIAAKEGNMDVVKFLLQNSADINAQTIDGWTPLHLAARMRHTGIVELLIENFANIKAKDNDGRIPLHVAAENGYLEIVKMLFECTREVNVKAKNDSTPLHLAALNGYPETVKTLISCDANVNAKQSDGWLPLHCAAFNGHLEVVKILIQRTENLNAKTDKGMTSLHFAAENGHLKVLNFLIQHAGRVNTKQEKGFTPLHFAIFNNHSEVVKTLIENRGDVNAKEDDGWTPLNFAAHAGSLESVKTLLLYSANANAKTNTSLTPLHSAAQEGHLDIVKLLIANSGNVNAKHNDGWTPLHYAAESGHSKVVKVLIDYSGNVHAKDIYDRTPLHLAALYGHSEVVRILIDHFGDINAKDNKDCTPLLTASVNNHLEVMKILLNRSCNVNAKHMNGGTALHLAATNGNSDIAKLLIAHSANVNAKFKHGMTPLHLAAQNGHTEILKILINSSGEVNSKEVDEWTPLHFAAQNGHIEAVKLLIQHSANRLAKTKQGLTPLRLAVVKGHNEVARFLNSSSELETAVEFLSDVVDAFKWFWPSK